jgi:hypothetical protein
MSARVKHEWHVRPSLYGHRVVVKLTEAQYNALVEHVRAGGTNISAFLRSAAVAAMEWANA